HRRGDPTWTVAGQAPAGAGSRWAAWSDVAAGIPARGEDLAGRGADFAGASRPQALEPRTDCGGSGIGGESPEVASLRPLHATGSDGGRSCGGGIDRYDRLAADRCALQPIGANSAFAGRISKSRRGHCHVRWSRGRSEAYRRAVGTWRIGELLPGAFSPRRIVP